MPDESSINAHVNGFTDTIPSYLRKPEEGTIQAGQFWLSCINAKMRKLQALGLRPHVLLLEHQAAMERWARGEGLDEPIPPTMKRQMWL